MCSMRYIAAVMTRTGSRKEKNQDSAAARIARTAFGDACMAIVCDGMGGLARGELASATAVRELSDWFENELPLLFPLKSEILRRVWRGKVAELNERISAFGERRGIRLGTTMTLLLLSGGRYFISHVGDSRCYALRGSLEQLTGDQSLAGREARLGNLTEEEAERIPGRNILLQCIGASPDPRPDFLEGVCAEGDAFLLCSDGLRHELSRSELQALFEEGERAGLSLEETASGMIRAARERGESDDISVCLVRARGEGA